MFDLTEFNEMVKLAEKGDAFCQNMLGARLATGYYLEKDQGGAFYWYCQAIKQGYTHAKWNGGSMILEGEIKGISSYIGMRLIEEAAKYFDNSACLFLSDCYRYGQHGKENSIKQADDWEKKAGQVNKLVEFSQPIDLVAEYSIIINKPILRPL